MTEPIKDHVNSMLTAGPSPPNAMATQRPAHHARTPPALPPAGWILLLAGLLGGGCGEISGNHPQVASARLFGVDGAEITSAVEVPDGDVVLVEARFYDAGGNELDLRYPEHATRIRPEPAGLLNVAPVAEQPFRRELSIRTPCLQGPLSLWIGYGHWGLGDEREFGSFEVRPVGEVSRVELFGPGGEQLTPDVKLPAGDTVRVEVRLFDCDGETIADPPTDRSILLYWSDEELAEAEPVDGESLLFDVTALQPEGTTGQMSIGYGTEERPAVRVLGSFRVEVVASEPGLSD